MGRYGIGHTTVEITDPSRNLDGSSPATSTGRFLHLDIWYPTLVRTTQHIRYTCALAHTGAVFSPDILGTIGLATGQTKARNLRNVKPISFSELRNYAPVFMRFDGNHAICEQFHAGTGASCGRDDGDADDGDVGNTNRGPFDPVLDQMMAKNGVQFEKAFAFDAPSLRRLPSVTIKLTLEYDAKAHVLTGPLVSTVLEAAGVKSSRPVQLGLRAVDGYNVALSLQDAGIYRVRKSVSAFALGAFTLSVSKMPRTREIPRSPPGGWVSLRVQSRRQQGMIQANGKCRLGPLFPARKFPHVFFHAFM